MSEFQDLIDLAQLNLMEEHIETEASDNSIMQNEVTSVQDIIKYKKRILTKKIISKIEAYDEIN